MKLFGSEQNLQSAVAIFVNENALNSDTCCRVISHRLGFYPSSSVLTGGPSSKAFTSIDVMQKPLLQLCCFYDSVDRVSAHDVGKWQYLIISCWVMCKTSVYMENHTKFQT